MLELLGERLQVSRAYIFENSEDGRSYSNTFEWCREGIESQKDMLQDMSYDDMSADYKSFFNERGILYCDDISRFPEDIREMLARQGIQSMLQCAIKDNGEFKGWVGFDDCTSKCMWTISQIEILSFISELLSLFLLKRRAQDNAMELAEDLCTRIHGYMWWMQRQRSFCTSMRRPTGLRRIPGWGCGAMKRFSAKMSPAANAR